MKRITTVLLMVASLLLTTTAFAAPNIEMVGIQGGCFQMGSTLEDGNVIDKPVHQVCVDSFSIGKFEVTQAQWQAVMGSNPSTYKTGGNYPVEMVSWDDVQQFIEKLRQQAGINYRLPTEAEWEYAARSGGKNENWAGTNNRYMLYRYMNFCDENCESNDKDRTQDDGYEFTSPVGTFQPNSLGLYDMSGNVVEWCQDWFDKNYYKRAKKKNPQGPANGEFRVIRGGSWNGSAYYTRAVHRDSFTPKLRSSTVGFRLAVSTQ